MGEPRREVVLVRHGETEWSRTGQHTGRTDLPLTKAGRQAAHLIAARLSSRRFTRVLTSPLQQAAETCRLAGFGHLAEIRDELMEWDYGAYEGRTTAEIRVERPGWSLWDDGAPGGETAGEVGRRADKVMAELRASDGDAVVFAHGHILRVLAACWIGLPATAGAHLALDPTTISILGYEREVPVIVRWNEECQSGTSASGMSARGGSR